MQYYTTNQLAVFGATGSPPSGALALFYPNCTLEVSTFAFPAKGFF